MGGWFANARQWSVDVSIWVGIPSSIVTVLGFVSSIALSAQDAEPGARNKWEMHVVRPNASLCSMEREPGLRFASPKDCAAAFEKVADKSGGKVTTLQAGTTLSVGYGPDNRVAGLSWRSFQCRFTVIRIRRPWPLLRFASTWRAEKPDCSREVTPTQPDQAKSGRERSARAVEVLRDVNFDVLEQRAWQLEPLGPGFDVKIWRVASAQNVFALSVGIGTEREVRRLQKSWERSKPSEFPTGNVVAMSTYDDCLSDARVSYVATLSAPDHCTSRGERLQSAWDIVRRDRENFHGGSARDEADFADVPNRGAGAVDWRVNAERPIELCPSVEQAILTHTPTVEVILTPKSRYARVIQIGKAFEGCP